ncbi:hypothetical protein ACFQMA_11440 [Halosimplex aquaticum]|uniref:DUF2617 family protein n=1 Tax=Halosimplex aquaticum TaxID=3026162 RepID=A0ABD5Y7R0_9EURY|nr:hypothetical protein [Halosimplex aquaticum]
MTENTLHFVHSASPPASDVRVFDSLSRRLLGAEFTFRVIGSSHYVSAPAYEFHELSSCEPVDCDGVTALRLDGPTTAGTAADAGADESATPSPEGGTGSRRRIDYAADGLRCSTVVERRPLSAFPVEAAFDLSYWFGPDAVTTVDVRADGYETYHTYPEFDLALFTRTVFESVPDGVVAGEPAESGADDPTDHSADRAGQPTD